MQEYLITCDDDDWELPYARWPEAFRPNSLSFDRLPGPEYRIQVAGVPIFFADESPGIQVCIEGELPETVSRQLVSEVLANLERLTGLNGKVIEL